MKSRADGHAKAGTARIDTCHVNLTSVAAAARYSPPPPGGTHCSPTERPPNRWSRRSRGRQLLARGRAQVAGV